MVNGRHDRDRSAQELTHRGGHRRHEQILDQLRLVAGRRQLDQLLAFAERWPDRRWAVESAIADLRRVDRQLADIDARIAQAVVASRTTLTDIVGVGPVLASVIIGHAGDISRFTSREHFASYAGTAPIEASSADRSVHRLSRRGNRRLNAAIHMVALSHSLTTAPAAPTSNGG